jgi:glycosyltransferase involved in cell wall biosynthesis
MNLEKFGGRVGLQQRVLPAYRVAFFDALAEACAGGLSVFAGLPLASESIATTDYLEKAQVIRAHNRHLFTPSSPLYQCWQDGILGWLENWQPDVLIVEANPRYLTTHRAIRWMHRRKRPVIGWGLGAPALSGPLALWRRWSRLALLRSLDGIVAYSQNGADEYCSLSIPAERVFVAPNAVAPRPTNPPVDRPAEFVGRPGVLFVGRLQTRKRIDNLLRACAALPEAIQPRLWIVGDGPARQEFEELAASVYPQAEFTGARHGAELEEYFAAADLFVLPGTGGLAVQQAMSYGLPVLVAEADGTQNDLVREENGWLIPPDNLEALVEVLQAALSDPARLRRKGSASYHIVSQEVNLEMMVKVFMQALDSASQGRLV